MEPAIGPVLVLDFVTDERAAQPVGRGAVSERRTELDGARVGQLEEAAEAAGDERLVQLSTSERGLVVAVENAGQGLEIEGQVRDPCELRALLRQPLFAEEDSQDIGPVDEGQVVLV